MLKNTVLEAKEVWKGYGYAKGSHRWVLIGVNIKVLEGEFISILGKPDAGKSTLLKILGFLELPDKGAIYFHGRLVGKSDAGELEHMHNERVYLIDRPVSAKQINIPSGKNFAVVLIDKPDGLISHGNLLTNISYLNSCGIAVVMATRKPVLASHATSIYKLSGGKIEKLNGSTV